MSNLVKLLINLAESDEHKQQFDKDPESLFDDSGISSEQREALRTGDVDAITQHLNRELTELQTKIATPSAKPWSPKQTNVTLGAALVEQHQVPGSGLKQHWIPARMPLWLAVGMKKLHAIGDRDGSRPPAIDLACDPDFHVRVLFV